jgi:hypothetical protein
VELLQDLFGRKIRWTRERKDHILEHPEMAGLLSEISRVLSHPDLVKSSISDDSVVVFYDFLENTLVGSKWLCVVVKYSETDAFIVTAYLTDKVKAGRELWPIR